MPRLKISFPVHLGAFPIVKTIQWIATVLITGCTPFFFFFYSIHTVYCSKESSEKKKILYIFFFYPFSHLYFSSLYVFFFFSPVNHITNRVGEHRPPPKFRKRRARATGGIVTSKSRAASLWKPGKKHNGGGCINWLNNGFPLGSCSVVYPRGYETHACGSMLCDRAGKESSLAAINNRWNALASRATALQCINSPTKRSVGADETSSSRPPTDTYPSLLVIPPYWF